MADNLQPNPSHSVSPAWSMPFSSLFQQLGLQDLISLTCLKERNGSK